MYEYYKFVFEVQLKAIQSVYQSLTESFASDFKQVAIVFVVVVKLFSH